MLESSKSESDGSDGPVSPPRRRGATGRAEPELVMVGLGYPEF